MDASIVIPARNEQTTVKQTLDAVKALGEWLSVETIVVDAGSDDRTAEVALQCGATVIESGRVSPGVARNIGVARASGRVLIFLDGDIVVTDSWLSRVRDIVKAENRGPLVTGQRYSIKPDAKWLERSWFGAMTNREERYIPGGNMICDACVFSRIGGFDESLTTGEDADFCWRAKAAGFPVVLDDELRVIHLRYPDTIGKFWTREAWHGTGDTGSLRTALRSSVFVASVLFVGLVLGAITCAAAGEELLSVALAITALGMLLACSAQTFRAAGWGAVMRNVPLYAVYLSARFTSLLLPAESINRIKNAQNQAGS